MKPADYAIAGIAVIAVGHNIVAAGRHQQLISERVDDYRCAHPWLTNGTLLLLALHLMRGLPSRLDPLYWLGCAAERAAELFVLKRHIR